MILTKSDSKFIRTRAFSTLSTLSTYASSNEDVLSRIVDDMKMPKGQSNKEYLDFITQRLNKQKEEFVKKYYMEGIEEQYSGLFSLIMIAKEPSDELFAECSKNLMKAVKDQSFDKLNEIYFLNVFSALKNSTVESVLLDIITTVQSYIAIKHKS